MKNSPKLDLFNNFLFHVCQVNDVDRHKDKSSHGFLSSLRRGHHWHWYPYKSSGGWESKSIAFLSCTVWPRSIEFGSFCSWKIPFYSAFAFFFFFFCHNLRLSSFVISTIVIQKRVGWLQEQWWLKIQGIM